MARPRILILTAVALEAKWVARALGISPPSPACPTRLTFHGADLCVAIVGIRAKGLGAIPTEDVDFVVMAGLAGALDPSLAVGRVVTTERPAGVYLPSHVRCAPIYSSERIIATPDQKRELFQATGAAAVDMETAAVREWAKSRGLPFMAVRAISDRADQCLDAAVLVMVDPWGRPRIGAILRSIVRRPFLLRHLLRLRADSKLAGRNLGLAVRELVEKLAGSPQAHA